MARLHMSHWFAILLTGLILMGFISARVTLKQMRERGREADAIFYDIVDAYQSIDRLCRQSAVAGSDAPPAPMVAPPSEWPEPERNTEVSFHTFNSFASRMVAYDRYLDRLAGDWSAHPGTYALKDTLQSKRSHLLQLQKRYNEQVREYNTFIKQFPRNFFSSFFNFQPRRPFPKKSPSQKQE
jgi:hypothetical protein